MKMVRLTMMLTMARMMVMKMMMKMVRLTFMSLPLAIMPKTLVFTAFLLFVQHAAQGCGARHVVTSILVLLLLPALLRYCLRSTPPPPAPLQNAQKKQKSRG